MANMKISVVKLGLIEYQTAFDLQQKLLKLRQQGLIEDVLLLLEHPPVITVGVNGKETNILVNEEVLEQRGVKVYHANRGGDVTYHGPGQIVGYPILNLTNHGKDVRSYIRRIEEIFIRLLKEEYGLIADRDTAYPGVWVGNDKIVAVGCAMKRWVTMHGFAFNVNTCLEHFHWIISCGISNRGVTSLEKLLEMPQDIEKNEELVIKHFSSVFQVEPIIVEKEEFLKKITGLDYE